MSRDLAARGGNRQSTWEGFQKRKPVSNIFRACDASVPVDPKAWPGEHFIVQPELRANLYPKSEPTRQIGAGPSDLSADLRLRYEITDRVASYVGVGYRRAFSDMADFARPRGADADDARLVIGVSAWF